MTNKNAAPERIEPCVITISGPSGRGKTVVAFAIQTMMRQRFLHDVPVEGDTSGYTRDMPQGWEIDMAQGGAWRIMDGGMQQPVPSESDENLSITIAEMARDMRGQPYEDFALAIEPLLRAHRHPVAPSRTAEELARSFLHTLQCIPVGYREAAITEMSEKIQSALDAANISKGV